MTMKRTKEKQPFRASLRTLRQFHNTNGTGTGQKIKNFSFPQQIKSLILTGSDQHFIPQWAKVSGQLARQEKRLRLA